MSYYYPEQISLVNPPPGSAAHPPPAIYLQSDPNLQFNEPFNELVRILRLHRHGRARRRAARKAERVGRQRGNQAQVNQLDQMNSSLFHLSRDPSSLPAVVLQRQKMIEDMANARPDPTRFSPAQKLTLQQIRQLVDFVKSSPHARRMPFDQIPAALGLDCPERTITLALARNGFKSYPAIVRPRIDETTRQARLHFATTHVQWTVEQWKNVLFTGDMRLYIDQPHEAMVTREAEEGLHPDCINHIPHSPADSQTNMLFIAHFSGATGKGPFILWNALMDCLHGNLTQENYFRVCYPSFEKWLDQQRPTALFAQQPDREMAFYSGVAYRDEVQGRHMTVLSLPPASPDLNPLTEIFNHIQAAVHADRTNPREYYDCEETHIARIARQTWKSISDDYVRELMESMTDRCQAVIDADGLYTRF